MADDDDFHDIDNFRKVQTKISELDHYIEDVDKRIDSLMEQTRASNEGRHQEIKRLKNVQEHMKSVYQFRFVNMSPGGLSDVLEGKQHRRLQVEFMDRLVERLKGKEDRINEAVSKYEQGHLDPDAENSIFRGVDKVGLKRELCELNDARRRVLDGDPVRLFEKQLLGRWAKYLEDPFNRPTVDHWGNRECQSKHTLFFLLVFIVLFVTENECHKKAFRVFFTRLKATANHGMELIDKFVYLLQGADRTLSKMKNLKNVTANILESYSSMAFEESEVSDSLELLLDEMQHLAFVLHNVPPPTSDSSFEEDTFMGMDVIVRCEETVGFIGQHMWMVFGPCLVEWVSMISEEFRSILIVIESSS